MKRVLLLAVFMLGVLMLVVLMPGCSRPKPTTVQVDPALSTLVPSDTTLVIAANVEDLKKTALYHKYLESRSILQLDELGRLTGIDPRKNLWIILFLSDGKHNALLARGNFESEMETRLQKEGAQVTPYKMYHLVGSEQASVVFLNTSTAAMGNVDSLKNLLDARGKTNGPPASIAARMSDIPASAQLWAAYVGGGATLPQLTGNWANLTRLLGSVASGSMHFDLREGLKGAAHGITLSDGEGKQLNDALRGLVGLGRLSAPENQPDLLRALDGFKVTEEGASVSIHVDESAELVEKLFDYAGIH